MVLFLKISIYYLYIENISLILLYNNRYRIVRYILYLFLYIMYIYIMMGRIVKKKTDFKLQHQYKAAVERMKIYVYTL